MTRSKKIIHIKITYEDKPSVDVVTDSFNSVSDFKSRWFQESSSNVLIPTSTGGALASKLNVQSLLIEQIVNGIVVDKWSTIEDPVNTQETQMELAENIDTEQYYDEEIIEAVPLIEEEPVIAEEVVKVEDIAPSEPIQAIDPVPAPIPEKSQNFREKFLDREGRADAWENNIIEKMDRRIAKLEEFAKVLDGENDYLDNFKAEKLGQ